MNDVPEGYRMTEVGVIPADWKVKTLGEIVRNFVNGGTPSTQFENYWNGNIPWITGADILNQEVSVIRRYITNDAVKNSSTNIIKKGNLLLVSRTGVGKLAIAPFDIAISQDFTGIYVRNEELLVEYLFKYFDFNQSALQNQNQGTSIQGITRDTLSSIRIPRPPHPQQPAIASALSDVDALITALGQLITKKRNIKQGAMQQLLTGRKRLPGFGGEWEVKTLGELLQSFKLGGNYPNSEKETNHPLIKMGNINRGFIDLSKTEFITTGYIPSENDKLEYGDILFNTRNTLELVGKVSIWKNELPLAYYNSNLMRLEFKQNEVSSNFFMNYILNTKQSLFQLKGFATGTTSVAAIYTRDILKLEVPLPPLPEQQAIAQILSDMDTEIEAFEQKRDKYKAIKQGMMQELLTGKTRLV